MATKTYLTSYGEVQISTIKGKNHFLLMHDEAKTYKKIIDKIAVETLVRNQDWKLKT